MGMIGEVGMNYKRRAILKSAISFLDKAASLVEQVNDQESDSMDNMPENLQGTDMYEKMEAAVDNLEAALEHIESAKESIEEASA